VHMPRPTWLICLASVTLALAAAGASAQTTSRGGGTSTRISPGALSAAGTAASPQTQPAAPAPPPTSAVAAPSGQLRAVAPLSQQLSPQQLAPGGGATLSSSSPASTSPSQAAPSIAGGGGITLADCMRFWDKGTHMSKSEWQAACVRSLHRLDEVARELGTAPAKR